MTNLRFQDFEDRIKRVRKRPVEVRAVLLEERVEIHTLEGVMFGDVGDWLIEGVNGELYPCKPDIFQKTYEQVDP